MIRAAKNLVLWLRVKIYNVLGLLFWMFPINDNKVVAVNMFGRNPGDNLLPVTDFLLNKDNCIQVVWLVENPSKFRSSSNCKYVKYGSLKSLKELATAKVWLDNARKEVYPPKRKEQIYYQFWHGGLGIKKIEKDAISSLNNFYVWLAKKDSQMSDYMISNSSHLTNLYRTSFWYDGSILEFGYPKEESLILEAEKRETHEVATSDSVKILYAPTFRDYSLNPMEMNFTRLVEKLENSLQREVILYLRPHPINKTEIYYNHLSDNIIDISNVGNIQETILNLDVLVTDYSSIMFDSLIAGVKTVLYVPDYEKYFQHRGSYFKFEELPFPLALDEDELVIEISRSNSNFWEDRSDFLKRMGFVDKLGSTEKIANHIVKEMKSK